MPPVDEQAVVTRSVNAMRMAIAQWEGEYGITLSAHERDLFRFAFLKGLAQGVLEAGEIE